MTVGSKTKEQQEKQSSRFSPRDLAQFLRVKQWTKNFICFAPILFAVKIHEWALLEKVIGCFAAFCLASSSIYILNDICDRNKDCAHPKKRNRPIAAGKIDVKVAAVIGILFAIASLSLGLMIRPILGVVILLYLGLMVLYSLHLKHIVLVDIFCIATGFVLRALGGMAAATLTPSGWFLLCTSFGALFLALEKRRQEFNLLKSEAEEHRSTLTTYGSSIIDRMEAAIVAPLLTCYALYSFQSPHGQWMLVNVPFVVFGIMRYQVLSEKHQTTGTPEEVLLTDRPLQLTIILWAISSALVVYNIMPTFFQTFINSIEHAPIFN